MPKIKTTNGTIRYSTIPLYEGVKLIDKQQAEENLHIFMATMRKHGVRIELAFGSLLGAVRDHDFIDHDEDIDLIIFEEDKARFLDSLHDLYAEGFVVARSDRRGLISVIRKNEYIDIYIFSKEEDEYLHCSGIIIPTHFLSDTKEMVFKGETFLVPSELEEYLVFEYGENWMTPVVWNNYSMPWYRKMAFAAKEKIKGVLPDAIYFQMVKGPEKRLTQRYQKNIDDYKKHLEKSLS